MPGAVHVLQLFVSDVYEGITPPAEILIQLADRFGKYLWARGRISLDQAFGLSSKQKSGHPLAPAPTKGISRDSLHWALFGLRQANPRLSIEAAAGQIINARNLEKTLGEGALAKSYSKTRFEDKAAALINALTRNK